MPGRGGAANPITPSEFTMKSIPIVVSTALVLMSAASFAQNAPMTPAQSVTPTQVSSKTELSTTDKLTADRQKASSEHYTKLDINKDGKLSLAEFNAMPKTGNDFGTLDSDKDGSLTMTEFSKQKMQ
jgi:hypothetical protein